MRALGGRAGAQDGDSGHVFTFFPTDVLLLEAGAVVLELDDGRIAIFATDEESGAPAVAPAALAVRFVVDPGLERLADEISACGKIDHLALALRPTHANPLADRRFESLCIVGLPVALGTEIAFDVNDVGVVGPPVIHPLRSIADGRCVFGSKKRGSDEDRKAKETGRVYGLHREENGEMCNDSKVEARQNLGPTHLKI